MYRIISNRAPRLAANIRTLHPSVNETSTIRGRVSASVSTCPRPDVHRQFLGHARFASSRQIGEILEHNSDPYRYTSGRWLRRDALEQESRLIYFDFDALCRRVLSLCPGASSITSYDKKEGGFNRVFIFHTDDAKRVVARLPFAFAGPSRLATNSGVATIKYLQAETKIPIPNILDWSDDASNVIGSEYIIMEHASGIPLQEKWPTMNVSDQIKCIKAICQKLKAVVDLTFPAYGSLYFAGTPYLPTSKLVVNSEFCIGPHCGAMYWNCNVGRPRYYHNIKPNQGPWLEIAEYCDSLIETGISKIPPAGLVSKRPRYQGSIETHKKLLNYGRAMLKEMIKSPRIQNTSSPVMFHPDLHKRNIFVSDEDPTVVSAIIDWQSTSIEPAFWYADEIPDFAQPMSGPSSEDEIEPDSEACAKAYGFCTQALMPRLSTARSMDEAYIRPLRYCYRTWEDGVVAFREELIQTSQRWEELGFLAPSPFPLPCLDEITVHQKEYKLFEAKQQLRHILSSLLNTASDGWVPPEDWEGTESAHQEVFEEMLQHILGNEQPDDDEPIRCEKDLREIWPFDLKG
ncbi:kinase-like domain-containing protein [Phaeosphaeria sp. MPI-PUGE-AT-0046c]|nr:kinase-like domain-containing protein [Phaeosphaeria sp. MPI-PUGE-AT-0046c]